MKRGKVLYCFKTNSCKDGAMLLRQGSGVNLGTAYVIFTANPDAGLWPPVG